jgi:hypothetical protein
METIKPKTEPWTLESLDIQQIAHEGEAENWIIKAGGAQQPEYKVNSGYLDSAVNTLIRMVTRDAIEDEAREWTATESCTPTVSCESMDWCPGAEFKIYDDGDPHGQLAIILPGGQLMNCGGHADLETDLRRARWICDALNAARAKSISQNTERSGASSAPVTGS